MKSFLTFYKVLFRNPVAVSAPFPTSKTVAKAIASYVPNDQDQLVVELGAGTGAITEALLKRGIAPHNVVAIELSEEFSKTLKERFPNIHVINGSAADLMKLLQERGLTKTVRAVVSSLPLHPLPKEVTESILNQVNQILPDDGFYIRFTYGFKETVFEAMKSFELVVSKWLFRNIPPAHIKIYQKKFRN